MGRSFVVNASPLIPLARIDRLDLLTSLAENIVVPQQVMREVEMGSDRDAAAEAVRGLRELRVVADVDVPRAVDRWDLGAGESQVLSHALMAEGAEAILDDRAARRCAQALGIPYAGSLGVVITCRHRGVIAAARPVVLALQKAGIRLAPALIEKVLAEVGE